MATYIWKQYSNIKNIHVFTQSCYFIYPFFQICFIKKTIINPNRLMIKKNTSITCTQKFKIFTDFNLIFFYAATNMTSAKNQKKKQLIFELYIVLINKR